MTLAQIQVTPLTTAWARLGTSDERVLTEVLCRRVYRRVRAHFDVEASEHWLDLGANIGAFALYCRERGATAECYEPEPGCFAILRQNVPDFVCHETAVTNRHEPRLPFWTGRLAGDHYRATACTRGGTPPHPLGTLPNTHAEVLVGQVFDGVKMDIEGAEGGLLDEWLLPQCRKLVLEYHTSRDSSMENLARRLELIRQHFTRVDYPPEYDKRIKAGGASRTHFDRMIFAWNER